MFWEVQKDFNLATLKFLIKMLPKVIGDFF